MDMRVRFSVGIGLVGLVVITFLFSCDRPFAFSPFEARVDASLQGTTKKNLERLRAVNSGDSKPFTVALLADTHYHFDNLADALREINKKDHIAFVIVAGDLAESGLVKDFEYFHSVMAGLKKPYLTTIGNHDYLAQGGLVYQQMFGAFNYAFVFNNVKFVMFDNVRWESNKIPDYGWLQNELAANHGYDHVIPVSHIPPFDKQFTEHREYYHRLLLENNITLSLHGHKHEFSRGFVMGDSVEYVTIGSPQKRAYCELHVSPGDLTLEKVSF